MNNKEKNIWLAKEIYWNWSRGLWGLDTVNKFSKLCWKVCQ